MNKITEEINRELGIRTRFYGRQMRSGKMSPEDSDKHVKRLAAARTLVEMVEDFIVKAYGLTQEQDAWLARVYAKKFEDHIKGVI